eukprot:1077240-Prymnesium_polylepis.2
MGRHCHFEASWADGDGSLIARSASGSPRPYVVRLASASFRGRTRAGIAGRWLEIAVALGAEPLLSVGWRRLARRSRRGRL